MFLTNQFALPALTICALYRCQWQVELFFKWIKQHLRIKRFYGTSENAVRTQIWIAISVYVLVAIIKEETSSERVPAYAATDLVADALRETAAETSCCGRRANRNQPRISQATVIYSSFNRTLLISGNYSV